MRGELIAREILRAAFPEITVDTERIAPAALSDARYIYVQATGGSAPHPGRVDSPTVEVVCYGRGTREEVGVFADSVTKALVDAWGNGFVTPYGHLTRFRVNLLPRAQAITGLPTGVHRYSAQYSLVTRPAA